MSGRSASSGEAELAIAMPPHPRPMDAIEGRHVSRKERGSAHRRLRDCARAEIMIYSFKTIGCRSQFPARLSHTFLSGMT
jgi:hypothetical protein